MLKANQQTTDTTTQVGTALGLNDNHYTTYTDTEVDTWTSSGVKANQSTICAMNQVGAALSLTADQATTYTPSQFDNMLLASNHQQHNNISQSRYHYRT